MGLVEQLAASQLPSPTRRRSIRLEAKASLRDVAAELGVTPTTVMRWERGEAEPRRSRATAYRHLLDALKAVGS